MENDEEFCFEREKEQFVKRKKVIYRKLWWCIYIKILPELKSDPNPQKKLFYLVQ